MSRTANDAVVDFGDEDRLPRLFRHPFALIFHLLFRAFAIVAYLFAGIYTGSFIISFLVVLTFLSLDFWTVKNITGRLLVGLRWWNFVDQEGKTHWRFEKRKDQSRLVPAETRIFWAALFLAPLLWSFFFIVSFFTFRWSNFVVIILGFCMSAANLWGYLRCNWTSPDEMRSYFSQRFLRFALFGASKSQQATPAGQQ